MTSQSNQDRASPHKGNSEEFNINSSIERYHYNPTDVINDQDDLYPSNPDFPPHRDHFVWGSRISESGNLPGGGDTQRSPRLGPGTVSFSQCSEGKPWIDCIVVL